MNHEFVAVIGTTGVGKSIASKVLSEGLHFQLFEEKFDDNPYLADYYQDPKSWAYRSQMHFFTEILGQTKKIAIAIQKVSVVQDSHIAQYLNSYARAQWELGHMEQREWDQYRDVFGSVKDTIPNPTLLVWLQAKIPVMMDRIRERNRSFEKPIDQTYVELLDRLNRQWLNNEKTIPVLQVKTDTYDIAHDPEVQYDFVENTRAALRVVNKTQ